MFHRLGSLKTVARVAGKVTEFVRNRILYVILRHHWCDITVLNAHATSKDKSDARKDSFYDELQHAFSQFLKYYMRILLAHFSANLG